MKGPGSFRLAGEIAYGVHVACAHSPEALAYAAERVLEGAGRVGRQLDSSFDFCLEFFTGQVVPALAGP